MCAYSPSHQEQSHLEFLQDTLSPASPSVCHQRLGKQGQNPLKGAALWVFQGRSIITASSTIAELWLELLSLWPQFLPSLTSRWREHGIMQKLASFFCRWLDSKHFRLCRPRGPCCNESTAGEQSGHRRCANEQAHLRAYQASFTEWGGGWDPTRRPRFAAHLHGNSSGFGIRTRSLARNQTRWVNVIFPSPDSLFHIHPDSPSFDKSFTFQGGVAL